MTSTIKPIDAGLARHHGFQRPSNHAFAKDQPLALIQTGEVAALVATAPIVFAKMPNQQYVLAVLTGLRDGRNLLIDDEGRWGAVHVPNFYRSYPFSLQANAVAEGNNQSFMLCFDHASGLYREHPNTLHGENLFFQDDGEMQEFMKQLVSQLSEFAVKQRITQKTVDALAKAELLIPWQIHVEGKPDEALLPNGIFRIDEAALAKLDDETLIGLHKVQALGLAYAQLLSLSRINILFELHRRRQKQVAVKQAPTMNETQVEQLVQSLGDSLGENLRFDWMKS